MATEIKVPTLGESVTTATVARWIKQAGEAVAADEPLVELETDKVTVEVTAPAAGVLSISVPEGGEVEVGALLGTVEAGGAGAAPVPGPAANPLPGINPPPRPLGRTPDEGLRPGEILVIGLDHVSPRSPTGSRRGVSPANRRRCAPSPPDCRISAPTR